MHPAFRMVIQFVEAASLKSKVSHRCLRRKMIRKLTRASNKPDARTAARKAENVLIPEPE